MRPLASTNGRDFHNACVKLVFMGLKTWSLSIQQSRLAKRRPNVGPTYCVWRFTTSALMEIVAVMVHWIRQHSTVQWTLKLPVNNILAIPVHILHNNFLKLTCWIWQHAKKEIPSLGFCSINWASCSLIEKKTSSLFSLSSWNVVYNGH